MADQNEIQLFDGKQVRYVWDEEQEKYFFSVADVIQVLTDSVDAAAYWRKLKQRLKDEGNETVTNCHTLKFPAADGKLRLTDVAHVARERLEQELGDTVISDKRAMNFTNPPEELPFNDAEEVKE